MTRVLISLLLSFSLAQSTSAFPEIEGENLEGQAFVMPQGFEGELNLVLIAFAQGQQAQIDTWLAYAETLDLDEGTLRVYEIPVLGSSYRLLRPLIDGGMRSGISDPAARARTITFYGDKPALMAALKLDSEKTVHALLVKPSGEVVWQVRGEASEENSASLEAYLTKASLPATYDGGL